MYKGYSQVPRATSLRYKRVRSRALGALRRLPYKEYHIVRSTCRKSVLSTGMKKNKISRRCKDGKLSSLEGFGNGSGKGSDGPSSKKGERRGLRDA